MIDTLNRVYTNDLKVEIKLSRRQRSLTGGVEGEETEGKGHKKENPQQGYGRPFERIT